MHEETTFDESVTLKKECWSDGTGMCWVGLSTTVMFWLVDGERGGTEGILEKMWPLKEEGGVKRTGPAED